MLNLADDRADRCPELRIYGVLVKFCGAHNFSFSVDKTKWAVIDFSKQCMNHSPVTTEGTTAEPPSNFQQRQISNSFTCFGRLYFKEKQLKDFHLNDTNYVLANIKGKFKNQSCPQVINPAFPISKCY